jgi:hypothetical protein
VKQTGAHFPESYAMKKLDEFKQWLCKSEQRYKWNPRHDAGLEEDC